MIPPPAVIRPAETAKGDEGEIAGKKRFRSGLLRGRKRACPECGKGRLFNGYLTVRQQCEVCANENGRYRADDGPAYFTILIAATSSFAPIALSISGSWSPWWLLAVGLPLVGAATLALPPFIKGGWIGVLWAADRGSAAKVS